MSTSPCSRSIVPYVLPSRRLGQASTLLSAVGSPYLVCMMIILTVIATASGTPGEKKLWVTICVGIPLLAPFLFTVAMMRRGLITDLHVAVREHRKGVFAVALLTAAVAYGLLVACHAPHLMITLGRIYLINVLLFAVVTLVWKISIHTAITGASTVILYHLPSLWATLAMGCLLLGVAWARVYSRRHTVAQVAAGAVLAMVLTEGVWRLMN